MRKILLILLLIVGCEETGLNTESLTEGTSVTDTLYVVNYDTTFVYDTLVFTNNDTIFSYDTLVINNLDTLYIEENNENFISVDWILVKNDEMWKDVNVLAPDGNWSSTFYSGTGYTFFGNGSISNHSLNTLKDDGILFFDYKTETFNFDLTDSYHNEAEKYFINSNNNEYDVSNIHCSQNMTYCHIIQNTGFGYIADLRSPFEIVDYR